MAETIIEIKNLHKYFGKNKVLKGIDLDTVSYTHLTLPTTERV